VIVGQACAKIILTGEHAVVYGYPAIAIPVTGCLAKTKIEPLKSKEIKIIARQLKAEFLFNHQEEKANWHPLELTLSNFIRKKKLNISSGFNLIIESKIPIASGMGSGAAISISMIRALAQYFQIELEAEDIYDQVMEIEKIYHGNPSGIDPKVIIRQKPLCYTKNYPEEILDFSLKAELVIIDSGIRSRTKKVVDWVGAQKRKNEENYTKIFAKIGEISSSLKKLLQEKPIRTELIGAYLNENQYWLKECGVSLPELDLISEKANKAGALGSKISGAGWGGVVIALIETEKKDYFQKELKKNGIANLLFSQI